MITRAPTLLTADAYAPYGQVLAAALPGHAGKPANQGTARRFDRLIDLVDLRPSRAHANMCVFRCEPADPARLDLRLLEKHPLSTQVFIPMRVSRFLVVVSRGDAEPDLTTLAVFLAEPGQAVSYRPGVWHHPMIALDQTADFACLVWEDDTDGDCVVRHYDTPYARVALP